MQALSVLDLSANTRNCEINYNRSNALPKICRLSMKSISKRGLANEVDGLSFSGPRWKSLKQRMQMGLPILDQDKDRPNQPPV